MAEIVVKYCANG